MVYIIEDMYEVLWTWDSEAQWLDVSYIPDDDIPEGSGYPAGTLVEALELLVEMEYLESIYGVTLITREPEAE